MVSLTLTNAVEIRHEAFFQCAKLSTVTVGDKIEVFYPRAFYSDYALTSFIFTRADQNWWYYSVSAKADRNDSIRPWADKAKVLDPITCKDWVLTNQNTGCFICSEEWVNSRGYEENQVFPHRTHFLED